MKFKVGDKVKVVKCIIEGDNCKNFNKVSTIAKINCEWEFPYRLEGISENFREDELALVEKQFTKSDLQNGDIVTFRNGEIAIKVENDSSEKSRYSLSQYNNKLEHNYNSNYDIVRIDRPTEYKTIYKNDEILDSTEKKYLAAVITPFRNKVECITKEDPDIGRQHISIKYNDGLDFEWIRLPDFKLDTMYVGMQPNKEYTLKELGL